MTLQRLLLFVLLAALLPDLCAVAQSAETATTVSAATTDDLGCFVHKVKSPHQAGETEIRILVPANIKPAERLPVVFVLPVEAGKESHYGDGLLEILRLELHEKHRAVYVAPTFFHLPWYVDHATDAQLKQETYFVQDVVPFVLKTYPINQDRAAHLLLGFSKSGWGAVSLLVRHPETFERAAAWDAPFMMDRLGKYGTTPIFGSEENLNKYQLPAAIKNFATPADLDHRLILTGYGGFRLEHERFHALLEQQKIAHTYVDGPLRKHDWHSGWVAEAVERLFAMGDQ